MNLIKIAPERVLNALAASNVGTWEWNTEDDICRCDPVAAAMFGVAEERAMNGLSLGFFVDRLHPEDRLRIGAQVAELRRQGGPYVAEYRTVPEPGRIRRVLARGRFDRDGAGFVSRACGIVIDVTESKQDGYVEGRAFVVAETSESLDALQRTADHAIRMRQAADALGAPVLDRLRPVMNAILYELGRLLGAMERQQDARPAEDKPLH